MNTCILMAKIVSEPELRYTQDSQIPQTHMLIEIEGLGANDTPGTLKAIGWGNTASEIKEKYNQGDQVILTGRLAMRTFENTSGTKEKRAELNISHVYPITASIPVATFTESKESTETNVVELESFKPKANTLTEDTEISPVETNKNLDDIPF
ncbi:MAG: single-stranded DNA-binding protein [Gloeocapsa sp. DLM2.Bin57]|nr:MAG: single-stranded DNA-binding protein [Gloeocapsa sp. DLM2.Bin57]